MNIKAKKILAAAAVLAGMSGGPSLYAYAESAGPQTPNGATPGGHGTMMGPDMGDMSGMSRMMTQMSQMMDTCNSMMKTAAQHGAPETPTDGGQQ